MMDSNIANELRQQRIDYIKLADEMIKAADGKCSNTCQQMIDEIKTNRDRAEIFIRDFLNDQKNIIG